LGRIPLRLVGHVVRRDGRSEVERSVMQTYEELLGCYGVVESHAIEEHKYFLGMELHRDPGLDFAVASWERHYAIRWRQEQMRRDAEAQIRAIQAFQATLSHRYGRPVDFNEAAREWVHRYGAEWRRRRELEPDRLPVFAESA